MMKFGQQTVARHVCSLLAWCVATMTWAVESPKPRQARPTSWPPDVANVFFPDAREHLIGVRPGTPTVGANDSGATHVEPGNDAANTSAWSQVIDGETLGTEVKRIVARMHAPLASAVRFKADGFKQCHADFSQLAVLFGVIGQYDGDVRWRDHAPALRDACAQASRDCRTGTEATFARALQQLDALDEVVRGGVAAAGQAPVEIDDWSAVADRSLLMLRMQTAWRDNVSPLLSDAKRFSKSADDVRHEAQMLALLAAVFHRQEYEHWDDETFADYARQLQNASTDLDRAATTGNYDAARQSSARIGQACAACHDGYRG